jgi:hypothetical protein
VLSGKNGGGGRRPSVFVPALTVHHVPNLTFCHGTSWINTRFYTHKCQLFRGFTYPLGTMKPSSSTGVWRPFLQHAPHKGAISRNSVFLHDLCRVWSWWTTAIWRGCKYSSFVTFLADGANTSFWIASPAIAFRGVVSNLAPGWLVFPVSIRLLRNLLQNTRSEPISRIFFHLTVITEH